MVGVHARQRSREPVWAWLIAAALVSACGSDEEEATFTAAAPIAAVAPMEAEHDGTVVVAGKYQVEVVPHASGQVYAYMLGETPAPDEMELTIEVPVRGRATGRPVRMRWNTRHDRYEGRVRRVEIVEGPIDVLIVVGGVDFHGHVDVCVLFPAVEVHVVEHRHRKHEHKHKHKHKHKHRGHGRVVHIY